MPDAAYPQHEKLQRVKDDSHVIGEFLETMQGQGVQLCRLIEMVDSQEVYEMPNGERLTGVWGTMGGKPTGEWVDIKTGELEFHPVRESINEVLAGYFDIDYKELMAEKDLMLDDIRAAARKREVAPDA